MRVRAADGAHFPVEETAYRDLLARRLAVHVHKNDGRLRAQPFELGLHREEGIFERRIHEGAALHVDDGDLRFRRLENDGAAARSVRRIVDRPQQARLSVDKWDDLLLVPNMIAAGDDRDAAAEQIDRNFRRDAAPVRRVLAVGDHEIDAAHFLEPRHEVDDRAPSRFTHNVAEKKELEHRRPIPVRSVDGNDEARVRRKAGVSPVG